MSQIQDWMKSDPGKVHALRNEVYACARRQAAAVAKVLKTKLPGGGKPRQTGFYKGLRVEPVKHDPSQNLGNCPTRTCAAGDPALSNMGETCEGYLWPYDDAFGLIRCTATPDYRLTFCPESG